MSSSSRDNLWHLSVTWEPNTSAVCQTRKWLSLIAPGSEGSSGHALGVDCNFNNSVKENVCLFIYDLFLTIHKQPEATGAKKKMLWCSDTGYRRSIISLQHHPLAIPRSASLLHRQGNTSSLHPLSHPSPVLLPHLPSVIKLLLLSYLRQSITPGNCCCPMQSWAHTYF